MKRKLMFMSMLFATVLCAQAQYVTSGRVFDQYGNPISGAKVLGKGTSRSVITGIDGSFSLETTVPVKKVEVSYMDKQKKTQSVSSKEDYTIVTLKDPSWWTKKPDRYQWFVSAESAFLGGNQKCVPLGLMVGYVKQFGGYVRGIFSGMPKTDGEIEYDHGFFTGEKKDGYMAVTAGGIVRLGIPLYLYVGAGYHNRTIALEHANKKWYRKNGFEHSHYGSYKGLAIDGGLIFNPGPIMINVGVTGYNRLSFHLGVGYKF